MCVIVDNNVAARVLLRTDDPEFYPISDCLLGNRNPPLRLVYGPKLRAEYIRNNEVRRMLLQLDRAGRAVQIGPEQIEAEEKILRKEALFRSNDCHVLALARASGVRLLVSRDQDLHLDFTNSKILNKPKGRVFQRALHARYLLRHGCAGL